MLTVVTWLWGRKYDDSYVEKLVHGFKSGCREPHRIICVTDQRVKARGAQIVPLPDPTLTLVKGCFARLRMFDPQWQAQHGMDDRIVCVDLDVVITGQLTDLFARPEKFVILQGANSVNPCPYNGSIWMLRAGAHPEVWDDFSLEAAKKIAFHEFPDDQGWFWHKIPNAAGWQVGYDSGIWAFRKRGWPAYDALPQDARLVCFPGARDPSQFPRVTWINRHWR